MSRLAIYIDDPNETDSSAEDKLVFSRAEYEEFVEATKEASAYAGFSNNISLKCEICGSYRPFLICQTTRIRDTRAPELNNIVREKTWRKRNPN